MTTPSKSRRKIVGRRHLLAAAGATLALPAFHVRAATGGAALVIGNSRYQWEASLPNVKRDAPDMAKHFQALGLKTELVMDAGRDAMRRSIDTFKSTLRGAEFGALYFAGHGAQWVKDSYVVPIDADLSTPNAVDQLIAISDINHGMGGAKHRLMVFDNCRNNPADGWRQLETERAAIIHPDVQLQNAPPPNTLVLFSTAPGRVALDGPAGENSPFCAALMRQLEAPTVDFQAMPPRLRRDLLIATEGRQVMWDRSSYNAPYQIKGATGLSTSSRGSSWGDMSRVVELTNAYAYAQQHDLPLPPGLIAHHPSVHSPDHQKVGAYQFVGRTPAGRVNSLLIVMSVESGKTAECIYASKSEKGTFWRFVTASVDGAKLIYQPRDIGARFTFLWSDANSGTLTEMKETAGRAPTRYGGAGGYSAKFTRLDG
ncbi:MAG TPA: caspase family protein [Reyranella sp.]|nr:caspase family protein [Reyranella sp.]